MQPMPHNLLRQFVALGRGDALNPGLHRRLRQLPLLPGQIPRRRRFRLDGDHLNIGVERARHHAGAGDAAAAAQGQQHHGHIRQFLNDFQAGGGHAGDESGFVHGMNIAIPLLSGQPFAVLPGLVEVGPVENQLGAQGFHGGHLVGVGAHGKPDQSPDAELAAGAGDGLAVIAAAGRDYAPGAFRRRHIRQQVDAAAGLESPQRQMLLVLQVHLGVQGGAQRRGTG